MPSAKSTTTTFTQADQSMAGMVRATDWSRTPLGAMNTWSDELRIAVEICLSSRFPMFVWWGPELINIYNDAYVPMLGKRHPAALGRPAHDSWAEIWPIIGPQAEAVMTRGEATWNERVLLVMERNGYPEETYFTWSYSPIRDQAGGVSGLFCACTEETQRVRAEADRDRLAVQRQLALDAARMGWWHYDPKSELATFDRRYAEIFGLDSSPRPRPNEEALRRLHPDDRPSVWAKVEAALNPADPKPYSAEYRIVLDDGSIRWVQSHGVAGFEGEGTARRATSFVGTVADVTERRNADAALRESEERFRLMADAVPQIIWITDAEGRALFFNDQWAAYTGSKYQPTTAAEVAANHLHPDDGPPTLAAFEEARRTGRTFSVEHRIRSAAGEYRWFLVRGEPSRDEKTGEITRWFGASTDIHDRKRTEQALRESEGRLSAILDNTPAMVYIVDTDHRFQFINRRWQPMFGLTNEQVAGRSIYEFFPREAADRFAANNRKVLETRSSVEAEEVAPHADGLRTYISVKVPLFDAFGQVYAVCGISADISELKRAEARNRLLVALDDAMRSLTDPAEVTATAARLLGEHLQADRCAYAEVAADEDSFDLTGDFTRDGVASIVGQYRFGDFGAEVLQLMREDKPYVVEDVDTHQPPVGDLSQYRQTSIRAVVCVPLHKAGRLVAAMAVHQRIPRRWTPPEVELVQTVAARCWESIERGRVVRALRQSEARFRELADAMPQMVWVTRPDGYHEYYNRRWYEFTGVPTGSTDGDGWNRLFHPADQGAAWERWKRSLATGDPYEIEYRLRHHSGEYRWTLGRALPIRDERGEIERWFGTCTDINAMKRLTSEREDLLERERIARAEAERANEAKSEFLATLSHELRTPLTPVLLTASLLESHPALAPELQEDVATIRRNVELESRLISDLLDLTRIEKGKLELESQDVDLHLIVRSAIDICQREASARLAVDLRASRHTVCGDSTRLQQVFWNLINNAIKFTSVDGTVTVRSFDAGEGRVRVEVSDTGVGIDASVLPRLFSAFEQGEVRAERRQAGLGLGLAISKRLAEAHGGTITAFSAGRGHGSCFTVELPVSDAPVRTAMHQPQKPVQAAQRQLNVMLVEDHEPTLRVMERLLRHIGHKVSGVMSVASAVAAARQHEFDLIICDLGLPDGSGLDVMRALESRYAGRAIALTGYGMESDIAASRAAGFAEHLTKPVHIAALHAAIERVGADFPAR